MRKTFPIFFLFLLNVSTLLAAPKPPLKHFNVIAYYSGDGEQIDKYDASRLTHIIFSFGHLQGNRFSIDTKKDSATIFKLVSLKKKYPRLKVILSLGGWGGCPFCSRIFNTAEGREEFASSSKETLDYFGADGMDLDWEYPAIKGFPGHQYLEQDKQNFTALVSAMRKIYDKKYEISFAAGGFKDYLLRSIEWDKVVPLVDRINIMSYDLVNGYASLSGHHTPLYSTPRQQESLDNAVGLLDSLGVPLKKLVAGAAFYARVFKVEDALEDGLYRPCVFHHTVDYKDFESKILSDSNYVYRWDSIACAPYYINAKEKYLLSCDDARSVKEKTAYAITRGLDGIMFWELSGDLYKDGLLQAIDEEKKSFFPSKK